MAQAEVADALRQTLLMIVRIGAPPLLAVLVVGVAISLLQAVTQINESTLSFVPKMIALGAVMLLLGGGMMAQLSDFTRALFDRMVAVGGS